MSSHDLRLTWDQLLALKRHFDALGPANCSVTEQIVARKVNSLHSEVVRQQKKVAECKHDYRDFVHGAFCVKCGDEEKEPP